VAVDLPAGRDGAGLAAYAGAIERAAGERRDAVLVAQSMGAYSASLAAARGVGARIVLVAPMIPAPGESAAAFWEASGQAAAERALAVEEGRDPDAPFDLHEMWSTRVTYPRSAVPGSSPGCCSPRAGTRGRRGSRSASRSRRR
jgi:hypothetical protein